MSHLCQCCNKNPATKHCASCKTAFYCSKDCQQSHWGIAHKWVCGTVVFWAVVNHYDSDKECFDPKIYVDYISVDEKKSREWMKETVIFDMAQWDVKPFHLRTKEPKESFKKETFLYYKSNSVDLRPRLYLTKKDAESDTQNFGDVRCVAIEDQWPAENMGLRVQQRMKTPTTRSNFDRYLASIPVRHGMAGPILEHDFHRLGH